MNRLDTEAAEAKPEVRSGLSGLHFFLTVPPGEEREASKDCGQASSEARSRRHFCHVKISVRQISPRTLL